MKHVRSAGRLAVLIAVLLAAVNVAPAVEQIAADDPIVYITATGKKYHRASCGHLNKSKKAVRLSTLPRNYGLAGIVSRRFDLISVDESKNGRHVT